MTRETVMLHGQGDLMLHGQRDLMLHGQRDLMFLGQGDSTTLRGAINETCSQDKKVYIERDQGLQREAFNKMSIIL